MKRQLTGFACVALTLGSISATAFAFDGQMLREFDTDGDGAISVDEANRALKTRYAGMDADRNGVVTEREFTDANLAKLQTLDANGDGKLTRDEARASFRSGRLGLFR